MPLHLTLSNVNPEATPDKTFDKILADLGTRMKKRGSLYSHPSYAQRPSLCPSQSERATQKPRRYDISNTQGVHCLTAMHTAR